MPHMEKPQRSPAPELLGQGERETEFFNHWVGQNFAGDAFDLRLRLFARQSPVQRELKIFSLAHALQALVAHLLERALNGFALRIENTLLQRDVNVGCHKKMIINDRPGSERFAPAYSVAKILEFDCSLKVQ